MRLQFALCAAMVACAMSPRVQAADFTVSNTANTGAGSLRQAIIEANASPGPDRIRFNIPGSGLQVIRVASALPVIIDPVEIDGYTQPGSSPNTLADADNAVRQIELLGNSPAFHGLVLQTSNSVIRGLSIRKFNSGIDIEGSYNHVVGNMLGSDSAPSFYQGGNVPGNSRGLTLGGECCLVSNMCCNIIGGVHPSDRNVIAGNSTNPIRIGDFAPADDTTILGNFLGVDSSGIRPSGNQGNATISFNGGNGLIVGGLTLGARNVMASYLGSAIRFYENPERIVIAGNYMGAGADGISSLPLMGNGVEFLFGGNEINPVIPVNCRIEGNRMVNCRNAVILYETIPPFEPVRSINRVSILRNSIYTRETYVANPPGGINLGSAARNNDLLDLDEGANNRQNYPELDSAIYSNGSLLVTGVLRSTPGATFHIEFFGSAQPHPSGFGEGELYLGFVELVADFDGVGPFQVVFPGASPFHPFITATATDTDGNTSMFSRPRQGRSSGAPLIHLNPAPASVLPYTNATFSADASGAAPLTLQWRHNGIDIPQATNATLTLSNVIWETRGAYSLVASNALGVAESSPAQLTILAQPVVLVQPADLIVAPGTNVTFSVQAAGILPIFYQWQRNGVPLPGATNASLSLTNIDWTQGGSYTVVLSNLHGVTESAPASLSVKMRPLIVQPPLSQSVVSGGVVVLSVVVTNSATLPLSYFWRSNNLFFSLETAHRHQSFLTLSNVRSAVNFTVVASNYFGPPGVLSTRAEITVLADSDGDGLPDAFEDAYQLDRGNPADAALDADLDGQTNIEEYAAGTDPSDSLNQLRIDRIAASTGIATLEFAARSNKTYAIEVREAVASAGWQILTNLPARASNRVERVTEVSPAPRRYYRLRTPAGP